METFGRYRKMEHSELHPLDPKQLFHIRCNIFCMFVVILAPAGNV